MDRSEEWRVFVAVAGRRSFVEAARALRRSPQAITRAVAALE
jgi:DNA-binding transcriptional LysR family regulator